MTTSVEGSFEQRHEPLTEAVARRLRGRLAEKRISGLQLAMMTGLGRSTINRRLQGETAMNTDELDAIQAATGISVEYLMTGKGDDVPPRPKPDGGNVVRHQGLEPRTRWLMALNSENVVEIPFGRTDFDEERAC